MDTIGQLTGTVKYYDWGGISFIPSLLGIDNEEHKPFAEYWLGVHPQAECQVIQADGSVRLLRDYFTTMSPTALGEYVARKFGSLPYLLKALDVKDMLSIQVHPSKADAEKEFAEENAKSIPLDSPQRNYKDDNHKPELMVAMGEFWLLHGFKPEMEMKKVLSDIPELRSLLPVFEQTGYKGLYKKVMEMPQEEVNAFLKPLINRLLPLYKEGQLKKSDAGYWAAKAALTFSQDGKMDRGIFSVYFFNLVELHKGQAIFQDAGVPHAYLEGQNVEIMASSDNVLRGGLTTKHIDVKELLKHVKCEPMHPDILQGEKIEEERVYKTPAPDFELSSFHIRKGNSVQFIATTAEILLLVEGRAEILNESKRIEIEKGRPSAIVFPGHEVKILATEESLVYKGGVPGPKSE